MTLTEVTVFLKSIISITGHLTDYYGQGDYSTVVGNDT